MTGEVSAFPLTWPAWRPRTKASDRKQAAFRAPRESVTYRASKPITIPVARGRLADEMDKLRASYVVLSTNLELRLDGQPRGGQVEPSDPGVALYFRLKERPIVLACDRWDTVAGNIAAIAAHVEALRGQERWGVGSVEQAFAGFAALPAPDDWRALLGHPADLAQAEMAYRSRMRVAHPDVGGSEAAAAALSAAISKAREAWK